MATEDTRNDAFSVKSARTGTSPEGRHYANVAFTSSNPNSELHEVAKAATQECSGNRGLTLFAGYTVGAGGEKTFNVLSAEGKSHNN